MSSSSNKIKEVIDCELPAPILKRLMSMLDMKYHVYIVLQFPAVMSFDEAQILGVYDKREHALQHKNNVLSKYADKPTYRTPYVAVLKKGVRGF